MSAVCPHCDGRVLEAVMRKSGRTIRLDPEPSERGNLHLIELGQVVEFIAPDRRASVPPDARYQSHRVTCPANERTLRADEREFIADVDRRLETPPATTLLFPVR